MDPGHARFNAILYANRASAWGHRDRLQQVPDPNPKKTYPHPTLTPAPTLTLTPTPTLTLAPTLTLTLTPALTLTLAPTLTLTPTLALTEGGGRLLRRPNPNPNSNPNPNPNPKPIPNPIPNPNPNPKAVGDCSAALACDPTYAKAYTCAEP